MIGNVLLLDFPFCRVENQNNSEVISVAGTTLSSQRNGSWLTPAELTCTFGALRAQFSLPHINSHKYSYFVQVWNKPWVTSDLFNMCGIQRVTGFQFTSEQALVMLRDCLGLGSLQELQTHVPENKRLHLASQDRARHVCLHVNESQTCRVENRLTLFSATARWTCSSWLSRRD